MTNTIGIAISGTPTFIASGFQADFAIKNTGTTNTIYVGDSSVSPTTGRPIGPNSTLTWAANTASLYAVCAAGQTSTLDVYDSGNSGFDASALAAALGSQNNLNAQGIANAIFSTGITLPYQRTTLVDTTVTGTSATFPYNNIAIDTSRYTLLEIEYSWSSRSANETWGAFQTIRVDFVWSKDPSKTIITKFYPVGPGANFIQIPVYTDMIDISLLVNSTYNNPSFGLWVYATNGKQQYSLINSGGGYIDQPVGTYWNYSSNDGVNPDYFTPLPMAVQVWNLGTSILNPGIVMDVPANTSGADVNYQVSIPNNGGGRMRLGFTFASNTVSTTPDEIRWNPVMQRTNQILTGSWQGSSDSLFESLTGTSGGLQPNRPNWQDVYLPAGPIQLQLQHRNTNPAVRIAMFWPDRPSF